MPTTMRCRADLEEMARDAVRLAPGCAHIIDVELRFDGASGRRPNWRLVGSTPPLPPVAMIKAFTAVEKLAQQYLMIDG